MYTLIACVSGKQSFPFRERGRRAKRKEKIMRGEGGGRIGNSCRTPSPPRFFFFALFRLRAVFARLPWGSERKRLLRRLVHRWFLVTNSHTKYGHKDAHMGSVNSTMLFVKNVPRAWSHCHWTKYWLLLQSNQPLYNSVANVKNIIQWELCIYTDQYWNREFQGPVVWKPINAFSRIKRIKS